MYPCDLFTHNNNVERFPIAGKHFLIEQTAVGVISEAGVFKRQIRYQQTSALDSFAPRPQALFINQSPIPLCSNLLSHLHLSFDQLVPILVFVLCISEIESFYSFGKLYESARYENPRGFAGRANVPGAFNPKTNCLTPYSLLRPPPSRSFTFVSFSRHWHSSELRISHLDSLPSFRQHLLPPPPLTAHYNPTSSSLPTCHVPQH